MKVGLIGAGGIARAHSQAYLSRPQAQIAAVVDPQIELAEKIAAQHGAKAYASLGAMLKQEAVDMVDICTPSFTHKEVALRCLKARRHVLCEKPMALSLKDARTMVQAARRAGVYYMTAQVIRFWPEYGYLKSAHAAGTFGRLLKATFWRSGSLPRSTRWHSDPALSGLAPYDLHIHDADFICFLLGRPKSVRTHLIEDVDLKASAIRTQYEFDDGPIVEAEAEWYNAPLPFDHSYRAAFEGAVVDFKHNELKVYRCGTDVCEPTCLEDGVDLPNGFHLDSAGGIYNEIAYFMSCIQSSTPPSLLTPEDSLFTLRLLEAELESGRTGRTIKLG